VLRDYIWFDNVPVAMVDDTGSSLVVYYIHTDQLGTPQKMSDGSANIAWDNLSDPFGNSVATQGTNWSAANWGSFNWAATMLSLSNIRFPGQYFDSETGLNQNWSRDYDPTTGRYVQSDPVGLMGIVNTYSQNWNRNYDPTTERYVHRNPVGLIGSINTYSYVAGNPLTARDPLGLRSVQIGTFAGWGISVNFGVDPTTGSSFSIWQFGYGLGGGFSYAPKGGLPPGLRNAPDCGFAGGVASAGLILPGASIDLGSVAAGYGSSGSTYAGWAGPSASFGTSWGFRAEISGGLQLIQIPPR
jgi:RHS repeat-associated protein